MRHSLAYGIYYGIHIMNIQSIILLAFLLLVAVYAAWRHFGGKGGGCGGCGGSCDGCGGCCGGR